MNAALAARPKASPTLRVSHPAMSIAAASTAVGPLPEYIDKLARDEKRF
jgi:hypothetical protein